MKSYRSDHNMALMPGRSQSFIIVGLIVLVLAILTSIYQIAKLEEVVQARRFVFESKKMFADLENDISMWSLMSVQSQYKPRYKAVGKSELENRIDSDFAHLTQRLAYDLSQVRLIEEARALWEELRIESPREDLSRVSEIEKMLAKIDRKEENRIEEHQAAIINRTQSLTTMVVLSVFLSLFLILIALLEKHRTDRQRLELIDELRALKKEADSASEMKSKFLSTVSHEIRTPLNGIIGVADILNNLAIDEKAKRYVRTIRNSGEILLRIINDILDFSKIESGKLDLEITRFSVKDVIEQIFFALTPKANSKNLNFTYTLPNALPESCEGDPGRLSQILFNLVGNAIKFTSKGRVELVVDFLRETPQFVELQFLVKDTGEGIGETERNSLFIPFAQGKRHGTAGEEGTGLGLSISQQLVQAMGGSIAVHSNPGQGSVFSFNLRFMAPSAERARTSGPLDLDHDKLSASSMTPLFFDDSSPTILVVDDNPTNQIVAQTMLHQLGANVLLAANGREGVDMAHTNNVDMVLMDCQMPILNGYDATRKLRELKFNQPILAMTANTSAEDREKCRMAGMNSVLCKPLTLREMRVALEKYLPDFKNYKSRLADLRESIGVDSAKKVVEVFISTLDSFKSEFDQLWASADLLGMQKLGHRLKPSSTLLGASKLNGLFAKLEEAPSIESALEIHSEIGLEIISVKRDLGAYLG